MQQSFYVPHGLDEGFSNNGLGYNKMRVSLMREMRQLGWRHDIRDSDVMLHMMSPVSFNAIQDRTNILFTMWESLDVPDFCIANLRRADALIVPSTFCAKLFARYLTCPIHVVPLGVDTEAFSYKERKLERPFRFLWLGACNSRKGWEHIVFVWTRAFAQLGNRFQLYLKTNMEDEECVEEENMVLDGRRLSTKEIVDIYHASHAFMLPHSGEGFGLTLAEAMATGLPSITTRATGVLEFTDDYTVQYLPWRLMNQTWKLEDRDEIFSTTTVWPEAQALASAMEGIVKNYDKALAMGKRASEKMQSYTWRASAEKLSSILAGYMTGSNASHARHHMEVSNVTQI